MTKFRLTATGKLYHLIQLSIERIGIIPTAKKQKIKEHYDLEEPSPETMKLMGHMESDLAKQARIRVKFKIILRENCVYLLGLALTAWDDPGNQELTQELREISIKLAITTDTQVKVPARYGRETQLELNSSYLQKGMETDKGLVWFNHLTQLPTWAKENESDHLKETRWVEKEVFDSITNNVIRMKKEIKLEDRNRNDGKNDSRAIFPKDKEIWFCTFDKNTKVFELKKKKKEEEQRRPAFDRSLKPRDPVYERRKKALEFAKETSARNTETRNSRMVDDELARNVNNPVNRNYREVDVGVNMPTREEYDRMVRNVNNSGNMHDESARNVSNPVNRHYREVDVGVNMTTREKYDRTVRNVSNSGNMDQNENVGVNMNNREGYDRMARNVGNSRNMDQREEHCNFVRKYNNQQKCMFKDAGLQCDLLVPPPRGNVQTDLLATEVPHKLGVTEALLLPRSPLHPLLEEDIHLENERRRLEEFKIRKTGKTVTFGQPSATEVETDPEEQHDYEEIPEKVEHEPDHDITTPRSRLRNPIPVRQRKPHRVVLNCTPDQLPGAFLSSPMTQPQFHFQETPTPLPITTQWQEEEQELGATGGEGWERQVQDEEQQLGESGEEEWESEPDEEEQVEDNEELDWRRRLLGPNAPSVTEQKNELKILIDRELLLVHNLEEQINNSALLDGIYTHPDNKCSLLYQPNMVTVSTNPDHLSDSPQERVQIMQDLYEQILKAKEDRVNVLERLAEAEHVRRSKRLLRKPKKKYI